MASTLPAKASYHPVSLVCWNVEVYKKTDWAFWVALPLSVLGYLDKAIFLPFALQTHYTTFCQPLWGKQGHPSTLCLHCLCHLCAIMFPD